MSKRQDSAIFQDIRESIDRILSYAEGLEYADFLDDYKTQDAIIRNMEILGEATKLLSEEAKKSFRDIPWKDIAGTRDKLIHDYFGVNVDIIWGIVRNDIPQLQRNLKGEDG
jgi:uncharacterized protein with HEPN domain